MSRYGKLSQSQGGFNSNFKKQQQLFSGAPYSLGFKSNSFITPEDIGFTNNAVSKEFTRKILNQATVNSVLKTNLTPRRVTANVGLNFSLSAQNSLQRRLTSISGYAQNPSTAAFIPTTSTNKHKNLLTNFIFSQEMSSLRSFWNLLATPSLASSSELTQIVN